MALALVSGADFGRNVQRFCEPGPFPELPGPRGAEIDQKTRSRIYHLNVPKVCTGYIEPEKKRSNEMALAWVHRDRGRSTSVAGPKPGSPELKGPRELLAE